MSLSIVVPAYNEKNRIRRSLKKISSFMKKKKIPYEIIVVDDGSTDGTARIAKEFADVRVLVNKKNSGKGLSVRRGILSSKYNLILFSDADLATPIEEFDKMMEEISRGADIVVASRNLPESEIVLKQPFYRIFMGKVFSLLVRVMIIPSIKDTQCGFKLFKADVAKKIVRRQTRTGFSFDAELLFIAKKLGYSISEVPVKWIDKEGSKVDPLKDSLKMFFDLIKIRINSIKKKYD